MTHTRYYELRQELAAALDVPDDTPDREIVGAVRELVREGVPVIKPVSDRTDIKISDTETVVIEPAYRDSSDGSRPRYIQDGTDVTVFVNGTTGINVQLYANLGDETRAQLIVALGGIVPTT